MPPGHEVVDIVDFGGKCYDLDSATRTCCIWKDGIGACFE